MSEILALFRATERSLCVEDVAEQLERPISFIEAMVAHLEQIGYLEACSGPPACEACPLWQRCGISLGSRHFYTLKRAALRDEQSARSPRSKRTSTRTGV